MIRALSRSKEAASSDPLSLHPISRGSIETVVLRLDRLMCLLSQLFFKGNARKEEEEKQLTVAGGDVPREQRVIGTFR